MPAEKLLLVDGSNLLFQMFFGMPARITGKEGQPIQGVLGFVGALLKILKMVAPTHLVVLFDGQAENSRTSLLPGYKANRPDFSAAADEDNPYSQLESIYDALDFLGIPYAETVDCEVDDVISSYALQHRGRMEIIISSFDSDFFQLIDEHVCVLRYRGKKTTLCDAAYVQEKHGVLPHQYPDYKALTGDAADNIKGAEKVGPKTAMQLIHQFGSIHGVLAGAENITKPSVRHSIVQSRERLQTNYSLIRLNGSAALPFAVDELAYACSGITTTEVLVGINLR